MPISFDATTKTYSDTPKDILQDRVAIEIGDSKQSTFQPQLKVMRWDNEVNFSLRFVDDAIPGVQSQTLTNGVIEYKKGQYKARFYEKPNEQYEFEVEIPKKPPTNKVVFSINSKDLDFFFQPPLTQAEIDEGIVRPDNVVGSYAVYHKNRPINYEGGKLYRAGKAFHIYRPHVVDAHGNSIWADLNIDEITQTLTVTIDQTWLNNAVYPIIVDPTLGLTTVGATEDGNNALDANTETLSETATVTGISMYCYCDSGTHTWTSAIWADSAGVPGSRLLVGSASGNVPVLLANANWVTSAVSSVSVSPATIHPGGCFDVSTANLFSMFYDTTTGKNAFEIGGISGTPPDPFGAATTRTDRTYSMYITYTAASSIKTLAALGVG